MENKEYQQFLRMDLAAYQGQWIAISGCQVVSHGKTFNSVFNQAKKRCPGKHPFVTMVPGKEAWLFCNDTSL